MPSSFRNLFVISAICLLAVFPLAAAGQSDPTQTTEKTKSVSTRKAVAKKKGPTVEEQLQVVAQQIKQQQEQIQQQQSQIQQLLQTNTQLQQQVQQQGQTLQSSVQNAAQQAVAAQESVKILNTTVSDLQSETKVATTAFVEGKKAVDALENPLAFHYKGITLTPGGWFESMALVRSRNENADITSNFGSVPFDSTANANLSEFRASARGTRPIVVATSTVGSTKLTGYLELDFLGQAPTSNQVETNSFIPRQRQLWMQAEFKNGLTFTAGQFWSLMTTDRHGIATRGEFIPTTLEGSYVVGYTYVRQDAFRVLKNFSNKTWAGFEIANSETTLGTSFTPANVMGFNTSPNAGSPNGSTLNYLSGSTNGFSTNLAPDFIGKVAFEPGYGHFEIKGLARLFRDRIASTATTPGTTNVTAGGGIGLAAILPITKKADFIVEGLAGKGIGRYGASNTPDVTLRPDGMIIPLTEVHAMAGFEVHPQPKFDIFVYGGDEYVGAARYTTVNGDGDTVAAGYGSPLVNNTNCNVEVVPEGGAACGAQNKNIYDATGGFWYRLYKGPFGTFQYGAQLAFIHRVAWSGQGGAPTGDDVVGLTGFRFYLP
ncbi:MAG: hypothetical protein ABSD53_14060 [Terriglobales bacterium]